MIVPLEGNHAGPLEGNQANFLFCVKNGTARQLP